jgi:hypothetical protein
MVRWTRVIALLTLWLVVGTTLAAALSWHWRPVWMLWRVPSLDPSFLDLRSITAGLETERHGGDPLIANPYDKRERPVNYPRVWLWVFSKLHINDGNVPIVGVTFAVLYVSCASILILRSKSISEAMIVVAAAISLAPLFAIERGNNDLFVFTLVFFGCVSRREVIKLSAYAIAAALKIFPLVALIVHILWKPPKERVAPAIVALGIAGIFLLQWRDINAIRRGTPTDVAQSYGLLSIKAQVLQSNGELISIATLVCLWLIILLVGRYAWINRSRIDLDIVNSKNDEMFFVFGAIYLFSFVAGSNYDYRLIFLVPTLPFAFEMAHTMRCRVLGWTHIGFVLLAENALGYNNAAIITDVSTFFLAIIIVITLVRQANRLLSKADIKQCQLTDTRETSCV